MDFFETDEGVVSYWEPDESYQGYFRVLHGGIQATLLDEISSWVVFVKVGTSGFTKSIHIDYLDNVSVDDGTIELKSSLKKLDKKTAVMECSLLQNGTVKARGVSEYAIFSEGVARKKLHYPGRDAFY